MSSTVYELASYRISATRKRIKVLEAKIKNYEQVRKESKPLHDEEERLRELMWFASGKMGRKPLSVVKREYKERQKNKKKVTN